MSKLVLVTASVVAVCGTASVSAGAASSGSGPITLLQLGDYQSASGSWPSQLPGAQAGAAEINAAGGVNGRKIKVIGCDTAGSVNQGAVCAQKGVSAGAIASVGAQELNASGSTPVFQANSMAEVANNPLSAIDFTSPVSFPIVAGAETEIATGCAGIKDIWKISSNVVIFGVEISAGQPPVNACKQVLQVRSVKNVSTVEAPPAAPDEAPYVSQAMASHPKAVVLSVLPTDEVQIVKAFRQAGYKGKFVTVQGQYISNAQLLPLTNGALVGSSWPSLNSPSLAGFKAAMKKYEPKAPLDQYSLDAYAGMYAFANVAKTVKGSLTPASFLKAINKAKNVPVPVLGAVQFVKPVGATPRIFRNEASMLKLQNGTFKTLKNNFNPYVAPKS